MHGGDSRIGLPPDAARIGLREEELHGASSRGIAGLLAIRLLNYLTNYVVSRVPSFAVRCWWYQRMIGATFEPGAGVHLGLYLWYYTPRKVRITGFHLGARSRVNRDCCLDIRGGLSVGDDVSLSPEVVILTASHDMNDARFPVRLEPVVIQDHVWVGTRAMILPGVTLGRGCVVAAGSVVTRDVAPLTVVAGVPAKEVGKRDELALGYTLDAAFPLFE